MLLRFVLRPEMLLGLVLQPEMLLRLVQQEMLTGLHFGHVRQVTQDETDPDLDKLVLLQMPSEPAVALEANDPSVTSM